MKHHRPLNDKGGAGELFPMSIERVEEMKCVSRRKTRRGRDGFRFVSRQHRKHRVKRAKKISATKKASLLRGQGKEREGEGGHKDFVGR